MSQQERNREDRGNGKSKGRGQSKRRRGGSAAGGYQMTLTTWMRINALAAAMLDVGGAVRVGFTSDGGALAVGMYLGDEFGTEYIRPSEDEGEAFAEIAEAWHPKGQVDYARLLDQFELAVKVPRTPVKGA